MNCNQTLLITTLALALAAWGCGDDSTPTDAATDTSTPTDTSTGDGGDTGTPTDSGGGDAGDAGDAAMCRPMDGYYMGMDNCTGTEDTAASMRDDFGAGSDESAGDIAGNCGRDCFLAGMTEPMAFATCVTECFQGADGTDGAFTLGCAQCYTASVSCSAENCLTECLDGGDDCDMCRAGTNDCGTNCVTVYEDCSGLSSSTP